MRRFFARFVRADSFFEIRVEALKGCLLFGKSAGILKSGETKRTLALDPLKKARQRRFQALGNFFDVHQRNIPHTALDSAVVRPMKAASLCRLFLIDLLLLADATNSATKPDANIYWHWV